MSYYVLCVVVISSTFNLFIFLTLYKIVLLKSVYKVDCFIMMTLNLTKNKIITGLLFDICIIIPHCLHIFLPAAPPMISFYISSLINAQTGLDELPTAKACVNPFILKRRKKKWAMSTRKNIINVHIIKNQKIYNNIHR